VASLILDGGGAVLVPRTYVYARFTDARTIASIEVYADALGDVTLELSLSTFAAFPVFGPPVYTATLTGANKLASGPLAIVIPAGSVLQAAVSGAVIPTNITLASMGLELTP
jgi:hypothetical protein